MASNVSRVEVGDDGDLIIHPGTPFSLSPGLVVALVALAALLVWGVLRKGKS